jgi:hypothetical protein
MHDCLSDLYNHRIANPPVRDYDMHGRPSVLEVFYEAAYNQEPYKEFVSIEIPYHEKLGNIKSYFDKRSNLYFEDYMILLVRVFARNLQSLKKGNPLETELGLNKEEYSKLLSQALERVNTEKDIRHKSPFIFNMPFTTEQTNFFEEMCSLEMRKEFLNKLNRNLAEYLYNHLKEADEKGEKTSLIPFAMHFGLSDDLTGVDLYIFPQEESGAFLRGLHAGLSTPIAIFMPEIIQKSLSEVYKEAKEDENNSEEFDGELLTELLNRAVAPLVKFLESNQS